MSKTKKLRDGFLELLNDPNLGKNTATDENFTWILPQKRGRVSSYSLSKIVFYNTSHHGIFYGMHIEKGFTNKKYLQELKEEFDNASDQKKQHLQNPYNLEMDDDWSWYKFIEYIKNKSFDECIKTMEDNGIIQIQLGSNNDKIKLKVGPYLKKTKTADITQYIINATDNVKDDEWINVYIGFYLDKEVSITKEIITQCLDKIRPIIDLLFFKNNRI